MIKRRERSSSHDKKTKRERLKNIEFLKEEQEDDEEEPNSETTETATMEEDSWKAYNKRHAEREY